MLTSPLVVPVDVLNNGTIVNESYERRTPAESNFVGPAHNMVSGIVDELMVTTKLPKPSGTFRGNVRGYIKFHKTVVLDDDTTSKVIVETTITCPVGTPAADAKHLRQKMIGFLDSDAVIEDMLFRGEA